MILNHKRRSVERAEAFEKMVKRNDDLQSAVKVPAFLVTVASMRQVLIYLPEKMGVSRRWPTTF